MDDKTARESNVLVPDELDLMPLFGTVAYPLIVAPLAVSQPATLRLLDVSASAPCLLGAVTLRAEDQRPDPPRPEDCYTIGTAVLVHRLLRLPDGTLRVAVQGLARFEVVEFLANQPHLRVRVRLLPDDETLLDADLATLTAAVRDVTMRIARVTAYSNPEALAQIGSEADPARLAYLIAGAMLARRSVAERQQILVLPNTRQRLEYVQTLLENEMAMLQPTEQAPTIDAVAPAPDNVGLLVSDADSPGSAVWLRRGRAGAECVSIEAVQMPGDGALLLTGQRGDVMEDTVRIALSWVRAEAVSLGIRPDFFMQHDLHLHIPSGALPESIPSAGIAIATALVSLITGRSVQAGTALAGELTLHGRIPPIGQVREQALTALRMGCTTLILPQANGGDLAPVSDAALDGMQIVRMDRMRQVLEAALQR